MKKYIRWIILALLIFIFTLVVHELIQDKLSGFDTAIYTFVISFKNPVLTEVFKFFSFLASPRFLIFLSFALFFIFKNKKYGLLALLNLIFVTFLNQGLKALFMRDRPFEWMLISQGGYSFPSGHAMVSSAFYGMLIYLIWQTKIQKKFKVIWTVILSILIFFICLSRIYLGVHYASDIVAGIAISVSYLIVATYLVSLYIKK